MSGKPHRDAAQLLQAGTRSERQPVKERGPGRMRVKYWGFLDTSWCPLSAWDREILVWGSSGSQKWTVQWVAGILSQALHGSHILNWTLSKRRVNRSNNYLTEGSTTETCRRYHQRVKSEADSRRASCCYTPAQTLSQFCPNRLKVAIFLPPKGLCTQQNIYGCCAPW